MNGIEQMKRIAKMKLTYKFYIALCQMSILPENKHCKRDINSFARWVKSELEKEKEKKKLNLCRKHSK